MIDACAKTGDLDSAMSWYDKMTESGVTPGTHNFSTVVAACARAGRADMAETWLQRIEEGGSSPDVIVYSSAIDACSKAGEPERAVRIFERMVSQGVKPNVVAYSSLARPFAKIGDWDSVERFGQRMGEEGVLMNEYFLYALLDAYTNAKPRQTQRGEATFRDAAARGVDVSQHVVVALNRLLGRPRARAVLEELQIQGG